MNYIDPKLFIFIEICVFFLLIFILQKNLKYGNPKNGIFGLFPVQLGSFERWNWIPHPRKPIFRHLKHSKSPILGDFMTLTG